MLTLHIGFGRIEFRLHCSSDLKAKRALLLPLKAKLARLFNVACAEVSHLDQPHLGVLGFSCVTNSGVQARRILNQIVEYLESSRSQVEIIDHQLEVITF